MTKSFFGIDDKIKAKIQDIVAKISDTPGMWDHQAQTFTDRGMAKLKARLKDNPKYIRYAVSLAADDYEAEGISEGSTKQKPLVCKNCGKKQGEHRRDECPKGTKTAIGYTDYGPGKFEPKQKQDVQEGSAADNAVSYTLDHPVDKDYVYTIYQDGEKESTYHSLDQARSIVADMRKTSPGTRYKITRRLRSRLAGPKGQLPEQGVSEGSNDTVYPKFVNEPQDLSTQSTEKLKAFVEKYSKQAGGLVGTASQVKRVQAELKRRQQDESEAALEETQQVEEDPVARVERLARELQGR